MKTLLTVTCLGLAMAGCAEEPEEVETQELQATSWHAGSFRNLPSSQGDLVAFVDGLPHPEAGGYGAMSDNRIGRFRTFLDAMFEAIEEGRADGWTPDWCAVRALADDAGYTLGRFRDTASGRWFLYGRDRTSYGQASFFVNPAAKRDLVIEVPHGGSEEMVGAEGARLLKALAARVLIVNHEHRCSDPDPTECTTGCSQSDVAHSSRNAFQQLHVWLTDADPDTKFAQLHGMLGTDDSFVEVGDGTRTNDNPDSVSIRFAEHLRDRVPRQGWVNACQEDEPPAGHCGDGNTQARYTNGGADDVDACPGSTWSLDDGRFLHIEQKKTVRDDAGGDGWSWHDIRDALAATWPCQDGSIDCALGAAQTAYTTLACP